MLSYFIKRALISLPTLLGISLLCFFIVHIVPGGPVEQALAQWKQFGTGGETGAGQSFEVTEEQRRYLMQYYGFDKPLPIRYLQWIGKLVRLDLGESYYYEEPVWDIIRERLPVSIVFGVVSFFLTYLVCIPLGIFKAIKHNSRFDWMTSALLFFLYSVPPFALAILFIVLFCGGQFWILFPIDGFQSDHFDDLTLIGKVLDIAHHMFLPLVCYCISSFAMLTMLMKNSLMDQLKQDYVTTARAKGLSEKIVIVRHAVRNAILPIAGGFGGFVSIFFAGALLIEVIFSLQGVGRLSYESVIHRDFPVVLAIIMILSFLNIVGNIISDLLYVVIDPRIDFK